MRHLGECPCPRCLIKMKDIAAAGTRVDDQRRSHKRVDTQPLQRLLERVRGWAFKGRSMASKAFKKPLQELSLFPIRVSGFQALGKLFTAYLRNSARSRSSCPKWTRISMRSLCRT